MSQHCTFLSDRQQVHFLCHRIYDQQKEQGEPLCSETACPRPRGGHALRSQRRCDPWRGTWWEEEPLQNPLHKRGFLSPAGHKFPCPESSVGQGGGLPPSESQDTGRLLCSPSDTGGVEAGDSGHASCFRRRSSPTGAGVPTGHGSTTPTSRGSCRPHAPRRS